MNFMLTTSTRVAIAITIMGLSGCTTVNLAEMTPRPAAVKSNAAPTNVVERAVNRLFSVFASKGFVPKTSQKRVQSAASILLTGLKTTAASPEGYVINANDVVIVRADIALAKSHVEQTAKAAEVFLAIAPSESDLRKELKNLERALVASRDAQSVFKEALIKTAGVPSQDMAAFTEAVSRLRGVTDDFGVRVRSDNASGQLPVTAS